MPFLYKKIMEELLPVNCIQLSDTNYIKLKSILPNHNFNLVNNSWRANTKIINNKYENDKINIRAKTFRNNDYINDFSKNRLTFSSDDFSRSAIQKKNSISFDKSIFFDLKINNKLFIKSPKINDIQDDIFITKILFYLSIKDFPKFTLVNKRFYELIKIHIYLRLFFLEKKKNMIEQKNSRLINIIEEKRKKFYAKNNLERPNLKHSCLLLSSLTKEDLYELKNLFRNYKFQYEIIISILCIFLNIRPNIYFDDYGKRIIDFFSPGKKLLYDKNAINIIKKIDLDNINKDTFFIVEEIIQNNIIKYLNENIYSPSIINLVKFEFGIVEYFKAIRKYYINYLELNNNIFNEEEINFCQKMDECLNIYYKMKNYAYNKCQKYYSTALKLSKGIDLEQNLGNEIEDFNINNNI